MSVIVQLNQNEYDFCKQVFLKYFAKLYHYCGTFLVPSLRNFFSSIIKKLFQYHHCGTFLVPLLRNHFSSIIKEPFLKFLEPSLWNLYWSLFLIKLQTFMPRNFFNSIINKPFETVLVPSLTNLFQYHHCKTF